MLHINYTSNYMLSEVLNKYFCLRDDIVLAVEKKYNTPFAWKTNVEGREGYCEFVPKRYLNII